MASTPRRELTFNSSSGRQSPLGRSQNMNGRQSPINGRPQTLPGTPRNLGDKSLNTSQNKKRSSHWFSLSVSFSRSLLYGLCWSMWPNAQKTPQRVWPKWLHKHVHMVALFSSVSHHEVIIMYKIGCACSINRNQMNSTNYSKTFPQTNGFLLVSCYFFMLIFLLV